MKLNFKTSKIIIISLSLFLFLMALSQNALIYYNQNEQITSSGFTLFLVGGISILGGGLFEWFIWLANPIYFLAILLFTKNNKRSATLAITAVFIALSFRFWKNVLTSESGALGEIISFELGYYFWLMSMITLLIGMLFLFEE